VAIKVLRAISQEASSDEPQKKGGDGPQLTNSERSWVVSLSGVLGGSRVDQQPLPTISQKRFQRIGRTEKTTLRHIIYYRNAGDNRPRGGILSRPNTWGMPTLGWEEIASVAYCLRLPTGGTAASRGPEEGGTKFLGVLNSPCSAVERKTVGRLLRGPSWGRMRGKRKRTFSAFLRLRREERQ